ncbi:DUF3822 family protein [Marivirga arenosa]|uniref:DUF3822 family protein n=1 Tax=Marivirga arenosa TaxID=3059076 RepID=A0AA49JHY6_9BACT|nr:DUF3822 family protein [Marivirga sp. ABR2-2]WKK83856.2 DUF3822 family protein [Marivirga sp. ABR2-2]
MDITKEKVFKSLKKVKDDKFSIDKIEQYCLVLEIGDRDLQVAVIDIKSDRVLILEDYSLTKTEDEHQKVQVLKALFDEHHLLMVGFWKEVVLCFKNPKYCLAPLSYFSKDNARAILKMNCEVQSSDSVGYYKVNSNDSVNIFTYQKEVLKFIRSIYVNSKIRVTHQSGMLVNAVLSNPPFANENELSLYIDRFYLHAAVTNNGKLVYFNSFKIQKFEEYIKYINLICHEFKILKKEGIIKVWGYIKKDSSHFEALKKNFPVIEVGNRTSKLNFGFKFDEIPEHQYFDVFGNYFNL